MQSLNQNLSGLLELKNYLECGWDENRHKDSKLDTQKCRRH